MVNVVDRVPTYPGRVTLNPVAGQSNTYDMVRADQPVVEGTPINKALFDQFQAEIDNKAKVECGYYIGSGGSGPDSPVVLTFSFIPKALVVVSEKSSGMGAGGLYTVYGSNCAPCIYEYTSEDLVFVDVAWAGNSVSFWGFSGRPSSGLNQEGKRYNYIGIA